MEEWEGISRYLLTLLGEEDGEAEACHRYREMVTYFTAAGFSGALPQVSPCRITARTKFWMFKILLIPLIELLAPTQ